MKASALIFSASICVSGLALAQTDTNSAVKETTDPAKIAEIERHAEELASRQQAKPATEAPASTQKHKKGGGHKGKSHKPAVKENPPSDTAPATEEKR
jgi:hypothetical protein